MATTASAFAQYVNLSARELERWLGTDASVAATARGAVSGPEVLRLLRTPAAARTAADLEVMASVVSRITAERERRPEGDVTGSPWRHGLMNHGHDPLTWSAAPPPVNAVATPARQAPDPRQGEIDAPIT